MKFPNLRAIAVLVILVCLGACGKTTDSSPAKAQAAPPPSEIVIPGGIFVLDVPTKIANAKLSLSEKCAVDSLNAKELPKEGDWNVSKVEGLRVAGWALDDGTNPEVFVRLLGSSQSYHALTTSRGQRKDVSKILGIPESRNVGFELRGSLEHVVPGSYKIALIQISSGGGTECRIPNSVTIK
jgi:hypothetical protein